MTKAQILIVEDQELIARQIQERLKTLGYHVLETVASGEEAIALVPQLKPNLVLIDIQLKGSMDGIQAAEQLRARSIPVVFLTAHSDAATLERAIFRSAHSSKRVNSHEYQADS